MRLINVHTLELEEFVGSEIPPYCILSHRWEGKEITYRDYRKGRRKESAGYQKIVRFCEWVRDGTLQHDFVPQFECKDEHGEVLAQLFLPPSDCKTQYVWVDTCR